MVFLVLLRILQVIPSLIEPILLRLLSFTTLLVHCWSGGRAYSMSLLLLNKNFPINLKSHVPCKLKVVLLTYWILSCLLNINIYTTAYRILSSFLLKILSLFLALNISVIVPFPLLYDIDNSYLNIIYLGVFFYNE